MASESRPSRTPSKQPRPVEVFSVEGGVPQFFRFLNDLVGLNTHWTGKRTEPCEGEGTCPSGRHKHRIIYKAYAPAERWVPAEKHWLPGVIEATEHLEEILRGRRLRGEVWLLSRGGNGGKREPVEGLYCETFAEEKLRPAFDIKPVLLRFYHVRDLLLGVSNPLPAKLLLDPSESNAPTLPFTVEPQLPPQPDQKVIDRWREMVGKSRKASSSTSSTNGQGTSH